jgi:hypothetical protein
METFLRPLGSVAPPPEARPHRRSVRFAVIAAGSVLVISGTAIAAVLNPFAGISAANHPQSAGDSIPASALPGGQSVGVGQPMPAETRLLRTLSNGFGVYVTGGIAGELCVLIGRPARVTAESCGHPLSQAEPTTVAVLNLGSPGVPALAYGVTVDGVEAVSFSSRGVEQTVPVQNNVWVYEGTSQALEAITVHYADGATRRISH